MPQIRINCLEDIWANAKAAKRRFIFPAQLARYSVVFVLNYGGYGLSLVNDRSLV